MSRCAFHTVTSFSCRYIKTKISSMPSPRLTSAPHYTLQRLCTLALCLAVAATAAYTQQAGKDYFPLAVGSEWSYRGSFSSEGSKPVDLHGTAHVSGKALIRGKEYYKYEITSNFSHVSRARRPFEDVRYYRMDRGAFSFYRVRTTTGRNSLRCRSLSAAGSSGAAVQRKHGPSAPAKSGWGGARIPAA